MSDTVEFRHLVYLLAIQEGKNFTKAAKRVHRSQPAVSQQVRELEDDIGFPIFVRGRGRSGISTTRPGKLILRWARRVLKERREIFLMARAIYEGNVPPLRLGFSSFVTHFSSNRSAVPTRISFLDARYTCPAGTQRTHYNGSITGD